MLAKVIHRQTRLFALALLCLMVGCADLTSDEAAESETNGSSGKADTVGMEAEWPPETIDSTSMMAQSYALFIDSWIETGKPESTSEPEAWIAQFQGLVSVQFGEDGPTLNVTPCTVQLPEIDDREVEISDEAIQSVLSQPIISSVYRDEGAVRFATERAALVAGVTLADPVNDTLPEDDNDARLVDVDKDDEPAMTIRIGGHKVYVGMRYRFELDGVLTPEQTVSGDAQVRIDLSVYGDSVPFVNVKKALDKALGKLDLLSEKHQFLMTPMAAETVGCADVVALAHENVFTDLMSAPDEQ
jgi:hypothetical protein